MSYGDDRSSTKHQSFSQWIKFPLDVNKLNTSRLFYLIYFKEKQKVREMLEDEGYHGLQISATGLAQQQMNKIVHR